MRPRRLLRRLVGRRASERPTTFVGEGTRKERRLRVLFMPGYDRCNYRCPYCITGLDHARRTTWDSRHYLPIVEALTRLDALLETVELGIGGEPLTSDEILEGARRLAEAENVGAVDFVTNLSRSSEEVRSLAAGFPPGKLGVACTYHPSHAGDLGAFLDKIRMLREEGVAVAAGCVAYPPNLSIVAEMKARCDELGLPLFVNAFFGTYGGRDYPTAYAEAERETLRRLVYSDHDFEYLFVPRATRGEMCGAGWSAVMVAPNGDYYRCSYEYNVGLAPLGNLLRDRCLRLFDRPLPCPADHCFCTAETTNTMRFEERYERTGLFRLYRSRDADARAEVAE